jgi:cell division protease FtsH
VAKGLLEYETLSGQEIRHLIAGQPPVREADSSAPAPL